MLKERVYTYVKGIPRGKVTTYGQIARHLGNIRFSRAVGNILHRNPDPSTVPCHRVVSSQGCVAAGFAFGGGDAQRRLLEGEGIVFEPDGRIDLSKYAV